MNGERTEHRSPTITMSLFRFVAKLMKAASSKLQLHGEEWNRFCDDDEVPSTRQDPVH